MDQSGSGEKNLSIVGTWTWAFAQSGEPQENGKIIFEADGTMSWNGNGFLRKMGTIRTKNYTEMG